MAPVLIPPPKFLQKPQAQSQTSSGSADIKSLKKIQWKFQISSREILDALKPLIETWFPGTVIDETKFANLNSPDKSLNQTFEIVIRLLSNWSEAAAETPMVLRSGESYAIHATVNSLVLSAISKEGLIWGLQTIRQLKPKESDVITPLILFDEPRFPWRGCLLDCSRHFMPMSVIRKFIDMLSYHKMNRFHWHLVDDQGWRIEIPKYPLLTEIGAWRKWTPNTNRDGVPTRQSDKGETLYGGFYTRDDIHAVVAYAESRGVLVVPEIELPGHCMAVLASYKWLSCTEKQFTVPTEWGVFEDVFCAGKESTFTFLQDILDYVCDELFPKSPYIHIGGDECPKSRWKQCPLCQKRIKEERLANEHELQSWFIRRIGKYLASKKRALIGWDEILEGGLSPGAIVQSWRSFEGAQEAAKHGHAAIVSPTSHSYLDYPLATLDIRQCFQFDPIPPDLSPVLHSFIHGGEGCMWTERAPPNQMFGKVYPRLCAIATALWTPTAVRSRLTFDRFHSDLVQHHLPRLKSEFGVDCGDGLAQRPRLPNDGWQVQSTMGTWENYHPENALLDDIASFYWTNRCPVVGDVYSVVFTKGPITIRGFRMITGKPMAPDQDCLKQGILEYQSTDNATVWQQLAPLSVRADLSWNPPIQNVCALRVRVMQPQDQWLVISTFKVLI